jgi:hypothetical protein
MKLQRRILTWTTGWAAFCTWKFNRHAPGAPLGAAPAWEMHMWVQNRTGSGAPVEIRHLQ